MTAASNRFGAWTALVFDPQCDDNSATISACVGSFEVTIPINSDGKFVSALVYDRAIDGMPEEFIQVANGTAVAPWSRGAVLSVLEATAAVVLAAAAKTPCQSCGYIASGNTCCDDPNMEDLARALDHIAIARDWWGEQLPASPYYGAMTRTDHSHHMRNNRAAYIDENDRQSIADSIDRRIAALATTKVR